MASIIDKFEQLKDFKGYQPAADNIPGEIRDYITGEMIDDYQNLLGARISYEVVDNLKKRAEGKITVGKISKNPFFVTDIDIGINGAVGSACAIVKPGDKNGNLRFIMAHTDASCLRLTPKPVYIEADAEKSLACPSFLLSTEPYGSIRAEDWYGMDVDVVGSVFINGKRKKIEIPGRIKHKSFHVEEKGEQKNLLNLKVETGIRTLKELYSVFGFKSSMDFARARLYVVPHFPEGKNGRLIGNEFGAYGHDDRACVWAAAKAGLESIASDSGNTMFIFCLDKEEVGSTGTSGAYRGFFESVLKETLKLVKGKDYEKIDLPLDLKKNLLGEMPAISADVDIGMGLLELEDVPEKIDLHNTSLSGWGFYIAAYGSDRSNRDVSHKHVDSLISIMEKKIPGRKKRDRYQITGKCTTPDSEFTVVSMSDIFDEFLPCIEVGVPVIGLHNPRAEAVNIYDLFWLTKGYEIYLKS